MQQEENYLAQSISQVDADARYDEGVKRLLANKSILAVIMKECVPEYHGCTVREIAEKYIEGEPQIGAVGVDADETNRNVSATIHGTNTEDVTLTEGTIRYDVRFYATAPSEDGLIGLILNVEAQNRYNAGYPLLKRAIYYCSRMISAQYGTEFTKGEYGKIKKVYSIWVCMNPPKNRRNTITQYSIQEKHIPFRKNELLKLGYDYIALGHIHLPAELAEDRMYYAGSLEPTDKNDTGKHGYIKGEIKNGRTRTEFIPFASREYVHMEVEAGREMTGREMKEKISLAIRERGIQNIYKIILRGFRDPDMIYDTDRMDSYGNIVEILDETKPAYDYEKLKKQNAGNLLGWYIESFAEAKDDSVEAIALTEGVQAMLEAKGSKL